MPSTMNNTQLNLINVPTADSNMVLHKEKTGTYTFCNTSAYTYILYKIVRITDITMLAKIRKIIISTM